MDAIQAKHLANMHGWDDLDPEVRQRFRDMDLEFHYLAWYQVCIFHKSLDDRMRAFKRLHDQQLNM